MHSYNNNALLIRSKESGVGSLPTRMHKLPGIEPGGTRSETEEQTTRPGGLEVHFENFAKRAGTCDTDSSRKLQTSQH